jgi:hypothetical protein
MVYSFEPILNTFSAIADTKEERCNLINDGWDLVEKDVEDWYCKKPE